MSKTNIIFLCDVEGCIELGDYVVNESIEIEVFGYESFQVRFCEDHYLQDEIVKETCAKVKDEIVHPL